MAGGREEAKDRKFWKTIRKHGISYMIRDVNVSLSRIYRRRYVHTYYVKIVSFDLPSAFHSVSILTRRSEIRRYTQIRSGFQRNDVRWTTEGRV